MSGGTRLRASRLGRARRLRVSGGHQARRLRVHAWRA